MSMQSDSDHDMSEAIQKAERSDIICIILPFINQCLVLDGRQEENDPPKVYISPPLGSAERRLRQINQSRPHLKHARELAIIPWTNSISSLASSIVWDLIIRKVDESPNKSNKDVCGEALQELMQWERRALASMIRGHGPFHTLWSQTKTQ